MKWKIKAGKLLLDRQRSKGNDCSDCFSSPREIPISRLMIYQSVKRFFCYPQHCATRTFDFIMSTLFLPFPTLLFFSFPPVFEYLSLRNSHWTLNLIISENENKSSPKRRVLNVTFSCLNFSVSVNVYHHFPFNFRHFTFVTGWFSHRLLTHHL